MYKPTVATVIAKRGYENDWSIAFESHTGKRFEEDIPWAFGVDLVFGSVVCFIGSKMFKGGNLEEGMAWLKSLEK